MNNLLFKGMDKELNEMIYSDQVGLVSFFERVEDKRIDEVFSFVTLDKNGDKVFAGDKCQITYDVSPHYADKAEYRKETASIFYDDERCLWTWVIDDHWNTIIDFSEYETEIELIKDKDNDT